MPIFKRIRIIIEDDEAFFLTTITMFFNDHMNANSIDEMNDVFTLICVADLIYFSL